MGFLVLGCRATKQLAKAPAFTRVHPVWSSSFADGRQPSKIDCGAEGKKPVDWLMAVTTKVVHAMRLSWYRVDEIYARAASVPMRACEMRYCFIKSISRKLAIMVPKNQILVCTLNSPATNPKNESAAPRMAMKGSKRRNFQGGGAMPVI